jgi:hypothetical protein
MSLSDLNSDITADLGHAQARISRRVGVAVSWVSCLEFDMIRTRPESGCRSMALAMALFAITLNFLQPLVHAAMMRDGAPTALWTMFCNTLAARPDGGSGTVPGQDTKSHECCLGLAHAQALIEPSPRFLPVAYAHRADPPATEPAKAVGIRDGPHRPRGPPTLA